MTLPDSKLKSEINKPLISMNESITVWWAMENTWSLTLTQENKYGNAKFDLL